MSNESQAVTSVPDDRGVLTLTMDRPDKHNAFDDLVIAALSDALAQYSEDSAVRVLVLQATGRSFSAGADLSWMQRMAEYDYDANVRDAEALAEMLYQLYSFPVPTIARVQGAAYGGGVGLAACCDIVVAGPRAAFMLSEVKLGLIPATISPYVIAAIGSRASLRYFTTAERIDVETARELGLVSLAVSEEELDETVTGLIDSVLANRPKAVRAAKKLVHDVTGRSIDSTLRRQTSEAIAATRVSEEGQSGLKAFLGKS